MLMATVDPDRENPKPNWNSVYWKGNVENSTRTPLAICWASAKDAASSSFVRAALPRASAA